MAHTHHDHAHKADNYFLPAAAWTSGRNAFAFVALAGWLGVAAGFIADRKEFFPAYLVAFLFFLSISIGATFFVMVQHLTGSAWSVTVRRLMESLMRALPIFVLLLIPIAFGIHDLYHWSHVEAANDPILKQKLSYLNEKWFLIRNFGVLLVLSVFATRLWAHTRRQDENGSLKHTFAAEKWSAPGVIVLFLGGSVLAFDLIMSLDPHWFSTMFGVIFLTGGALALIATLIVSALSLRKSGYLTHTINEEHYHDLGKWLFALTVFWAYTSFSQYMLIWYGNLPEEIMWFEHRLEGSWLVISALLVVGHFLVPFFSLMPRAMKRNHGVLGFFAGWLLFMHFMDLYWQVMPVFHPHGFAFSWINLAALAAVGGSMGLVFWSGFREKPLIPVGDPRLKQAMAFHNV
ncbi:MAG: hypothetical protein KJZ84_14960 [Bryobacteraceae bacterium]|nr:hypothetical protein [Bryobacteraceae bacterium]